jgi:DNA polymerase (family 10)
MVESGEDLSRLHGVGDAIARKVRELVRTGRLAALAKLERDEGSELADLLRIRGLGPKRVRALHELLGVRSPAQLERAARAGRVAALPGFGARTEQAILAALAGPLPAEHRALWAVAEPIADSLVAFLRKIPGVKRVTVAGSFRRLRETVGDLDILVTCKRGTPVLEGFPRCEDIEQVLSAGTTRSTVVLRSGLQVDVRVVPEVSYGAALHYFTGSKAHNVAVRTLGVRKGLKINEYGVFRGDRRVAGRSEREVYAQVGLPYVEPELREDRGEIEAARDGKLPRLVSLGDIRGDLHVHTRASDGRATLEAMAEAGLRRGYEYLAITEHTQALRVARGLDPEQLRRQLEAIDRLNEKLSGRMVLLKAAEVDILEDGSLDLPDELLEALDLCVGAVHSHFELPARAQTERILRAMDHPRFRVLAHPTGRLIGDRDPYPVDVERLIDGAAERGRWLEINAQPQRLDLSNVYARAAVERGVGLAIATDAHAPDHLDYMRLGVAQARRGWVAKRDVLNTRSLASLRKLLAGSGR